MAEMRGKCTNFGNCIKADSGEYVDVPVGGSPVCPICGKPLTLVPTTSRRSPVGLLVALLLLGLLAFGAWKLIGSRKSGTPVVSKPANPGGSNNGGNFGQTPATPAAAPTVNPGDALMYYERSDGAWLQAAAEEFNTAHPGTNKLVLDFRGSREGKQDILYGKGHPVLWNPADTYWVDKLNLDWQNPNVGKHTGDVVQDSKTILTTRYVLVMWKDRAAVFSKAMRLPQYQGKTWALMSDLATKGWASAGGPANWGKLKLLHSDPTKSNGGQTTLALMFAEYTRSHPGASPSSPGFLAFMRGIENAVPNFSETTSKSLDAMLKGSHDEADIAVSYEVNALAAVDKGSTDISVVYPSPTVQVNFPAAIINADWVTPGETQMANDFVTFLLTRDVQLRAIKDGFRPALDDTRSAVDNALQQGERGKAGFLLDPPAVDRPVGTKVIDDLLYQWFRIYGKGSMPA